MQDNIIAYLCQPNTKPYVLLSFDLNQRNLEELPTKFHIFIAYHVENLIKRQVDIDVDGFAEIENWSDAFVVIGENVTC